MDKKQSNLDQLKERNPFSVPKGYMEGLTNQIMSQLPDKSRVEAKQISFTERVRPWLYLAAVFAGLMLFFKGMIGGLGIDNQTNPTDSLLVHTKAPSVSMSLQINDVASDEDMEYLEYIETEYATSILAEETGFLE